MDVTAGTVDITTYFILRLAATGVEATGLTITNFDLQYTRSGEVPTAKVDAVALAATNTAHTDNRAIEIDATDQPGLYRVDWPDAAFAAGAREVILTVKCATVFTEHLRVNLTPVPANVTQLLNTAWLAPGTAGTPDVNVKLWNGLTTVALPLVPTTAGRTLDVSAGGEAGLDWANIGSPGAIQDLSSTIVKQVSLLATDAISAAAVSAAAVTKIQAGLATAANLATVAGYLDTEITTMMADLDDIQARLPAALTADGNIKADALRISGDATAADNCELFFDGTGYNAANSTVGTVTLVATATNLTNAPTSGDFTATMKTSIGTAVAASAVASVTGNVGGNVNGSVGSVAAGGITALSIATGAIDADALAADALLAIANKVEAEIIDETDSEKVLTAITDKIASVNPDLSGLTLAAIASSVWGNVTRTLTAGTNINGSTFTAIPWNAAWDAEVQSECADALAAYGVATQASVDTIDDLLDTEIAAIISGILDLPTNAELATALGALNNLSAAQVWASASRTLSAAGLDTVLVDGKTLPAALQIIASVCAGKISGAGTGTEVFLGIDGVTTRVTVSADGSGNRTAVVFA